MTATPLPASHPLPAGRRPVLADAFLDARRRSAGISAPARSRATDIALVLAGAAVVAVLAQVEIPLPLVPITGQTLAVLVVGSALGARRGAAAMLVYAAAGLAGLPVFAGFAGGPASVLSPSFGFILGFIPAAALAGYAAERAWDRNAVRAFAGFLAATVVPFLVGVPYLAMIVNLVLGEPMGLQAALAAGVWPFIPGGIVKAAIAAGLIPLAWRGVAALERRSRN